MKESGLRNAACGADTFGLKDLGAVHWNLTDAPLYEHAIRNGEATIVAIPAALPACTSRRSSPT